MSWRTVKVEDLASPERYALSTGPFGSAISARFFRSSGVPVLRGANLSNDVGTRLSDEGLVFIEPALATKFERSIARRGDLVFTCWGTIDQVGLVDDGAQYDEYVVSNKQMKLTPDRRKADPLYLYYYFSAPEVRESIVSSGIGSSVPGFNLGQLRSMDVLLPPLNEQRAIAEVLGALDDKVELNRQMNRTLEEMASALFKSWFVDFDPVVAKAEGRRPFGMDAATAALFPATFDGPVPAGWEAVLLRDAGTWISGGTPSKNEPRFWGGDIPWISAKSIKHRCILDSEERVTNEGAANGTRLAPPGSVLFVVRGMSLADEFRFGTVDTHVTFNQDLKCIVPNRGVPGPLLFWFLSASQKDALDAVDEASHGTKRLQTNLIEEFLLALPRDISTRNALAAHLAPPLDLMFQLAHESRTLTTLRDALLPKLLSGEIRLKQANKLVEAAL